MPDFTSFDFIQTLKDPPRIILTTSNEKSAIKAFDYDCIVGFLSKPIDKYRCSPNSTLKSKRTI